MKILFATGNVRKISEARESCRPFDVVLEPVKLDIIEIQSDDLLDIAKHKAMEAFRLTGRPVVVTDTYWNIPALNGFPGAYMHDVVRWFSTEDFLNLMSSKKDRAIRFTETIVYQDVGQTKVFSKEFSGIIAHEPRGTLGGSIEKLAVFNERTLSELMENDQSSHNLHDYVWIEFAKWITSTPK